MNTETVSTSAQDLLSSDFSQAIQKAFDTETRRKNIQYVTRAYYVFIDLKRGITIDKIERSRLEPFHSFLWAYITLNKSDKLSEQLWELCDNALSKIISYSPEPLYNSDCSRFRKCGFAISNYHGCWKECKMFIPKNG